MSRARDLIDLGAGFARIRKSPYDPLPATSDPIKRSSPENNGGSGRQTRVIAAMATTELVERRKLYLRAVIRASGLASMAELAKKLEVTPSTLTNIRSANRSASPELIDKIKRLAPAIEDASILGAQAVANSIQTAAREGRHVAERVARTYREQTLKLQGLEEEAENIKDVADAFRAMDYGDVFVYLSATRRPLEMDPDETALKDAIANAIGRGANFLYLRPTRAFLRHVGNFVDIEEEFDVFKRRVLSRLPSNSTKLHWKNLLLIQADGNPLFVVPDFKWELFYSDKIDMPHKSLAGALIAAGNGPNFRVPLSSSSTKRILFEVAKTLHTANTGLADDDRVPDELITRLKESAERATNQTMDDVA
jgi:transcriptional regulator with XRE-family HTH domain